MTSWPSMVPHAFNFYSWKAEANRSLSMRHAWFILQVPDQSVLYSETFSKKTKIRENKKREGIHAMKVLMLLFFSVK